jgi:ABC-type antimicrobial peptide transport system permease subunit
LLRDRFLEDAEEEEYHSLLPKPQKKVKEGLLIGSVSGFIGVMVGGFATTFVLMMQTEARGYDADGMEYIFAVVCFWPFPFGAPLLGALLGALGGYLTSFVFRRAVVAVLVGFVIGVLVGVIAIIGFLDMQTILELWQ